MKRTEIIEEAKRRSISEENLKEILTEYDKSPIGQLEKYHQAADDLVAAMEKTLVGKVIVAMFRSINYAVEHPLKAIRRLFLLKFGDD